ncbi:glycosyltransferase family 2 protein [Clostridium drakei]|uniref:Glycosyltransferase 2-like domain-containing protein n=1 Tax=Clostridium drakei TaxID=332101 RepID=A0A2U8DWG4_9CLOT|nr:glycosyltransferase [Clostridium drakei]AWI06382.1 hypothetical protein B9W14_18385 [Clostridium drakei]
MNKNTKNCFLQGIISIIVPVYNVENYLERCLNSIINQTYKNIEIILVDDESKDSSYLICKKYEKLDPRIILVKQKNQGVSSARNYGLSIAKGEFIGFVDSDDYIAPTMYEILLDTMLMKNADIVDSRSKVFYFDEVLELYESNSVKDDTLIRQIISDDCRELYSKFFDVDIIRWSVYSKLFRRDVINDERFKGCNGEDTRFMLNIFKHCKVFVSIDNVLYFYFKGNTSSSTSSFTERTLDVLEFYMDFAKYLKIHKEFDKSDKCMAKYYILMLNYYARLKYSKIKNKRRYMISYKEKIRNDLEILIKNTKVSGLHKMDFILFNKFPELMATINYLIVKLFDKRRINNSITKKKQEYDFIRKQIRLKRMVTNRTSQIL